MATTNTKTENVYQKLLKARATFLNSEVTKSGKNMQLAFKYFELDDIVPIATKIFGENGFEMYSSTPSSNPLSSSCSSLFAVSIIIGTLENSRIC